METKLVKNRKATFLFKTEKNVLEAIKYLAEKDIDQLIILLKQL